MAHNLSSFNGRITMAYFGESPWHRLGTRLTDAARVDVAAAMTAAGLDWTVRREPLYLADGRVIDDRRAIVRDQDSTIFGTVGERFTPIQNREAFDVLTDVIRDAGVTIECAGALGAGETVWMLARFAEGREITKGDVINPYFLISQAHDGSRAYGAKLTPIRVLCQNTLTAAGRDNDITIRHTATAVSRLAEARRLVNTLTGIMDHTVEAYQEMAEFAVSDDAVRAVLTSLFPVPTDATAEVRAKQVKAMSQVGILLAHGKGADLSGKTAWGLYNAVTEYVDHVKPAEVSRDSASATRKANAISGAIFGQGDALKVKALQTVRALVAA